MKTLGTVALVLPAVLGCSTVTAQTFTPVTSGFEDVFQSSSDWGDYDGDGDLDFLLSGLVFPENVTKLYRNDDSGFVDIGAGFIGVSSGSVDWGDYDNDGDLDFIITNVDVGDEKRTAIYRNDGNDVFTFIDINVLGLTQGGVDWGDFDNDGDLDFVIMGSGEWPSGDITRVYRNDGGDVFTDIAAGLQGLRGGSVEWGDYDNDRDLDILQTGSAGFFDTRTVVYRNDGANTFNAIPADFFNLLTGQARWGDYDRDGDLDILVDGMDSTGGFVYTFLYRNDGSDSFSDIHATIPGAGEPSSIAWGDCDNDGDLDVAVTSVGLAVNDIYLYEGDSTFTSLNAGLEGHCCGSLAWGDYDRDGDLDLVISDMLSGTDLYRNDVSTANTPPTAPTTLQSTVLGDNVILSWQAASDLETGSTGLSYNVRVGTTPGGFDIVSPMADPISGYRQVVAMGNVFQNRSWEVVDLPVDTYFWSVQAIDNNFAGSMFADEHQFVIGSPPYVCGDINNDGVGPDISDLVYLVDFMFNGGPPPPILAAADVDSSGGDLDIADLVYLVDFMFTGGPPPVCE